MSEHDREIARIIRQAARESDAEKDSEPAPPPISVNGNHNTIALYGGKIVVRGSGRRPAANQKANGKIPTWREELEGVVLRQVWDLAMTTDQFFALISKKLGKHFAAMSDINDRELGEAYEIMMKMRRPALD